MTIKIKGYEVEYIFFSLKDREMDNCDIEHVGNMLEDGYIEGGLNQIDNETGREIKGRWKKV